MPRLLADVTPIRVSRNFRRLWLAQGVSNVGQQMTAVAVGIQVYAITGSSLAVGLVGLAQLIPLVGLGLYGGALSDSLDRRRIGMVATAGLAACSVVLVLQGALALDSVVLLYAVVAVQSGLFAVGNPARAAIVPRLVDRELLPAANALSMVAFNLGFTVGPLLGGAVIAATGSATWVYVVDVVAFTGTFYAMARLPAMRPQPLAGQAVQRAGWASVMEGLRFLKGRRNLQMSFYLDIVAMVFGMPRALFPAIAADWYGGDPRAVAVIVGLLSASPAIGAVLIGVLSGPLTQVRRQGVVIVIAVLVWGASIAAFGLVRWLPAALILLAVAGAADNVSAVFRSTMLQAAAPDHYRGRLQGIFTVVVAGGPRLGDVEAGAVAAVAGEGFSVVSGGLACIACTLGLVAWSRDFLAYDGAHPVP
ncbi:MAG: MFS transporter [Actinomycetota bacterium]|nr:MAG: MFS transporter [Actinomycetota bacterium]